MSTLMALLPARARFDALPVVQRRLLRGNRLADGATHEFCVAEYFRCDEGEAALPVAALRRQQRIGDAGDSVWLCAEPACVEADMVAARVLACGDLDLTEAEAAALAESLRPLLAGVGMSLKTTTPSRWHVCLAPDAMVPVLESPEQIRGDNLLHHLPAGAAGKRWRQLFNETQILLHQHPVNRARHQRGQKAANSLWLWGAGRLPQQVTSTVGAVFSDDPAVIALATLADVSWADVAAFHVHPQTPGDLLLDLSRAGSAEAASDLVLGLLDQRQVDALIVHFRGGECWRITRGQRWRIWRKRA